MYKAIIAALALSATAAVHAQSGEITVTVFPRANGMAMKKAYFEPFTKATNVPVRDFTYDGQIDELMGMIKKGKVQWDVMQVETRTLDVGCKEGYFEKLDPSRIVDKDDFVPGSLSACGVGIFAWSQALAYNAGKVSGTPASWADFWDLKKFPGKRGLRRSAKYTLEIALLANGVPPAELYAVLATKEGADRAFRKLDEIKSDIVWWEAAPQPTLFLDDNRVVMSSAYTLWISSDPQAARKYKIVWNGSLYDFDSWAIPKGSPRVDEAYKFIAFTGKPKNQKAFIEQLPYGPTNKKTLALLQPKYASMLTTAKANLKAGIQVDIPFWIRYGPELESRFRAWAPPVVRQTVEEHDHSEGHEHAEKNPPPHPH